MNKFVENAHFYSNVIMFLGVFVSILLIIKSVPPTWSLVAWSLVAMFFVIISLFLKALIQLAQYMKDEPIITENGANSSCDDKKDVA